MNKVRCFGVINLFQQSILFHEMVNNRYKDEYMHELDRLIVMLQEIDFESKKKFQKIHTGYGTWYCTVDDHTSCAFLLLVNQKYPQPSALRLKKALQEIVTQVPRYFDQGTGLHDKLGFLAKDLLINYDINEDYQNELQTTLNSIQTIDIKLDNGVPDQLTKKDHLNIRQTIDPEIQKILDNHRKEKERRSTLLTPQQQKQIADKQFGLQQSQQNQYNQQTQQNQQQIIQQQNDYQLQKQNSLTNNNQQQGINGFGNHYQEQSNTHVQENGQMSSQRNANNNIPVNSQQQNTTNTSNQVQHVTPATVQQNQNQQKEQVSLNQNKGEYDQDGQTVISTSQKIIAGGIIFLVLLAILFGLFKFI